MSASSETRVPSTEQRPEPEAAVIVTTLKLEEVVEIAQVLHGLMTTDADNFFDRANALLVRLRHASGVELRIG